MTGGYGDGVWLRRPDSSLAGQCTRRYLILASLLWAILAWLLFG